MICGSNKKKSDENALNSLRNLEGLTFNMNLGEFKFIFDEKIGDFKSNLIINDR